MGVALAQRLLLAIVGGIEGQGAAFRMDRAGRSRNPPAARGSPSVGTLSAAECALMIGFTSLSAPHRGVVLETRNEFTAGDVIYELAYAGEGNIHVWRRGEGFEVSGHDVVIRWDPEPETFDPRVGNWFELTRSNGTRGWAKDLDREAC